MTNQTREPVAGAVARKVAGPVVYDRESIVSRVGGDSVLLCALLQGMLLELEHCIEVLRDAPDAPALAMNSHRFKGALLQTGLMTAARVAGEMEASARRGQVEAARALLPAFSAEVAQGREQISTHFEELKRSGACECECEGECESETSEVAPDAGSAHPGRG